MFIFNKIDDIMFVQRPNGEQIGVFDETADQSLILFKNGNQLSSKTFNGLMNCLFKLNPKTYEVSNEK
jgi:hypothetical protein